LTAPWQQNATRRREAEGDGNMSKANGVVGRRDALALLGGAAGAAALPWGGSPARAQGQVLRAGITGFTVINTLDPAKASLIPENYILYGIFNALLRFNERMDVVGDLAESFAAVDATTLEFRLRRGVKFQDGSDFTADDVKFSIERVADERTASPNRNKVTPISDIRIVDPHTVRIVTRAPFGPLLNYLTNTRTGTQIVSRAAINAMGPDAFARRPVGTGRYMVKEWKPNESVELVGFPGAFEGAPRIMSVLCPFIAEESSGMTAILGNQLDLTSTAPFADVPNLERRSDVRVLKQPGLNTRYIALNNRRAPFDDVHFRRAVSMAFDRELLVRAVIFGEGTVTPSVLPPAHWLDGKPLESDFLKFNPARARAELAQSRYRAGQEGTVLIWGSNWWRRIGEIVVGQVNQTLGTRLSLQAMDFNAAFARARAGDYDAMVMGWLGLVDPDEYIGEMLGSRGFRNIHQYASERMDALLERGRAEIDQRRRLAIYREAELLAVEEMPVLPCFTSNVHNLLRPNVTGFTQMAYSNFADQFGNVRLG
jgi:peptide/nickel transport system substrate-binding protein